MYQVENNNYLSLKELEKRAAVYAQITIEDSSHGEQDEWLVFQLENELFTLSLKKVDEITTVTRATLLPGFHSAILGLSNVSGNPMLLVDLAQLLGLRTSSPKPSAKQRILIIKDQDANLTGLLIDEINCVTKLAFSLFESADNNQLGLVDSVSYLDESVIGRLKLDKLQQTIEQCLCN